MRLHWHECAADKLGSRDQGALLLFSYPALHNVRIDVVAQGHTGNRHANLVALPQHLSLKLSAVKPMPCAILCKVSFHRVRDFP